MKPLNLRSMLEHRFENLLKVTVPNEDLERVSELIAGIREQDEYLEIEQESELGWEISIDIKELEKWTSVLSKAEIEFTHYPPQPISLPEGAYFTPIFRDVLKPDAASLLWMVPDPDDTADPDDAPKPKEAKKPVPMACGSSVILKKSDSYTAEVDGKKDDAKARARAIRKAYGEVFDIFTGDYVRKPCLCKVEKKRCKCRFEIEFDHDPKTNWESGTHSATVSYKVRKVCIDPGQPGYDKNPKLEDPTEACGPFYRSIDVKGVGEKEWGGVGLPSEDDWDLAGFSASRALLPDPDIKPKKDVPQLIAEYLAKKECPVQCPSRKVTLFFEPLRYKRHKILPKDKKITVTATSTLHILVECYQVA